MNTSPESQIKRITDNLTKSMLTMMAPAMKECADLVLAKANTMAPAKVKNKGKVTISINGDKVEALVIYSGSNAISAHERLDLKHPSPMQAQFLAKAVAMVQPEMKKVIAKLAAKIKKGDKK